MRVSPGTGKGKCGLARCRKRNPIAQTTRGEKDRESDAPARRPMKKKKSQAAQHTADIKNRVRVGGKIASRTKRGLPKVQDPQKKAKKIQSSDRRNSQRGGTKCSSCRPRIRVKRKGTAQPSKRVTTTRT